MFLFLGLEGLTLLVAGLPQPRLEVSVSKVSGTLTPRVPVLLEVAVTKCRRVLPEDCTAGRARWQGRATARLLREDPLPPRGRPARPIRVAPGLMGARTLLPC